MSNDATPDSSGAILYGPDDRIKVFKTYQEGSTTAKEYVVTLDGKLARRTGGKSQFDYCEAASFAEGLSYALSLSTPANHLTEDGA
jgi:hypothetical protein